MPGPESTFSRQLGAQPILDYSETDYTVCGILLPAFHSKRSEKIVKQMTF